MKTIKLKKGQQIPENFTGVIEYPYGAKEWWQNGLIHRINGPAIEWSDGTKMWCQDGIAHRVDGPAIKWGNGRINYIIWGQFFSKEQFEIFQFMWENTSYRKTKKLMKMFVKLAKMK